MKADESQEIAIEVLEAVGAEEEAIDRRWHSQRHDDPGGSAGEKLRRHSGRAFINRKAGAQNLFEKTLQESRNVSEPERIKDDEMIRPANICLGLVDSIGRRSVRSEEHTSELQSLMRNSYAVFCLKKKTKKPNKSNK